MRKTKALQKFKEEIINKMKAEGPDRADQVQLKSIGSQLLDSFRNITSENLKTTSN